MLSTLHTRLGENLQSLLWKLESLGLKMVRLTWYHICQQHPANTKRYILMNPDFWADNQDEIGEKWEAMKAGL